MSALFSSFSICLCPTIYRFCHCCDSKCPNSFADAYFWVVVFQAKIQRKQFFGVGIGLIGSVGLVWGGIHTASNINSLYTILIFAASCCYAINIHFIKTHLAQVGVMAITLGNFVFMAPAALVVLIFSDFFTAQTFSHPEIYPAIGYITILALAAALLPNTSLINL